MFIIINNRPDRLGANLTWYFMQIIYAHYKKYFIHYHGSPFETSIFVKTIKSYIDKYNYELGEKNGSHDHLYTHFFIKESQQDWPGNNMIVCNEIQSDLISYFKCHIYNDFMNLFEKERHMNHIPICIPDNFHNNINFQQTIVVHLRLDDVVEREHYDGTHSTDYYRQKLESGNLEIDLEDERLFFEKRGISIPGWNRTYNPYDCQAPIPEELVESYIQKAKIKYPEHDVVLVLSPISSTTLPYKKIQSECADIDLWIMSQANVLICSKSLFCFTSVYLSNAVEIFIPMWGHIAGTGLTSKYDNTQNLTYL